MSSNKPDTSWFDLKNYDALKSMPIEGWISVIENRVIAYNDEYNIFRRRFVNTIKYSPIIDDSNRTAWGFENLVKSKGFQRNFSTGSVNSLSVYDMWLISKDLNESSSSKMLELNESCLLRNDSECGRDTADISF
ncbi:hypothetical protein QLH52_21330 [Methylomonas sp. OY6]|uniref:Uncharacterized protein n=1 Tax=Methylomonas defluvii TaxID=3045149 RepID=A0ABU4ULX4_9GAMM|nr:hypothetical protein [Methylomonas sp. OY6]MDX8129852.1 hypothetical protein [Methylomonas sp. OY6]